MICQICKIGTLKKGKRTVTTELSKQIFVFKNVPALICDNCFSYFFDIEINKLMEAKIKEAQSNKKEIQLLKIGA